MSQRVELADAPAVAGVTFRRYRDGDLPALHEVKRAQAEADGELDDLLPFPALEALFAHPVGWRPERDALIAEAADGRIVAWSWTNHQPMRSEDAWRSRGYVLPGHRRRGLGRTMLARNEAHLAGLARQVTTRLERWYHGWATDRMPGAIALFEAAGYARFHHYLEMVRVPGSHLGQPNGGLRVEGASRSDTRALWQMLNEAFAENWGSWRWSDDELDERVAAVLADETIDPGLWRVIREEGQLVAGITCTYDRTTRVGSIDALGTLAPYRGRGLGSRLLHAGVLELERRGAAKVVLQVDAADPGAIGLYERFGFRVVKRGIGFRKPLALED